MHTPDAPADHSPRSTWKSRGSARVFAVLLALAASFCFWGLAGCGVTAGPGEPGIFPTAHTQLWLQQFGAQPLNSSFSILGYGAEAIAGVAVDPAGNVVGGGYVAGNLPGSTSNHGESDAYLVKYSAAGSLMWSRQISTGSADLITGVSTDSAGNIAAVDATVPTGSNTATVAVVKTDPNGIPVWSQVLPGTGVNVLGQMIKFDRNGDVLVAGFAFIGGTAPQVLFMVKLSGSNGTPLWLQYYETTPLSLISGIAIDPQNNILVTGASVGPGLAFVAKLQGTDGTLTWAHLLSGPNTLTSAFSVASDADGNAIVGGATSTTNVPVGFEVLPVEEGFVGKFSAADGTQVWSAPVSTGRGDVVTSVQVAADGSILAAGLTNGILARSFVQPAQNVFIAKFAADATHISAQQFGTGPLVGASSYFQPQTALDAAGNLFICGATTGAYPGFTNTGGALQMFIGKFGPQ